ncbi:MAG: hypothetical protein ACLQNE_14015 [Thermoguttaceae bacterium]
MARRSRRWTLLALSCGLLLLAGLPHQAFPDDLKTNYNRMQNAHAANSLRRTGRTVTIKPAENTKPTEIDSDRLADVIRAGQRSRMVQLRSASPQEKKALRTAIAWPMIDAPRPKNGDIGRISGRWEVSQLAVGGSAIVKAGNDRYWFEGFDLGGAVEGDSCIIQGPVIVQGTKRYDAAGATNTIPVIRPFVADPDTLAEAKAAAKKRKR